MAKKNTLFMLEMGDPINIVELAKCIAVIKKYKLSSFSFKEIGIREGEKISEILYDPSIEDKILTEHNRVYALVPVAKMVAKDKFMKQLKNLLEILSKPYIMNHSRKGSKDLLKILAYLSI
jgi:FlaA1/EpsC-like NDP-sugar epimerase